MPNKTPLSEIKKKLPSFVEIEDSSYKGIRYNADFIDTEYNEKFSSTVYSVIQLQHGCHSRACDRKSITLKKQPKKQAGKRIIPIEVVKSKLPSFLEISEETYQGVRYPATFFDKDYSIHFQAIVANMMKGKGYCQQRKNDVFRERITIKPNEINDRIKKIYNNKYELVEETYSNTNTMCDIREITTGRIFKIVAGIVLSGKIGIRQKLERWKAEIKVRDKWTCVKCDSENDLHAHHIETFKTHPELRFTVSNGACLCADCHFNYHANYRGMENEQTFQKWLKE